MEHKDACIKGFMDKSTVVVMSDHIIKCTYTRNNHRLNVSLPAQGDSLLHPSLSEVSAEPVLVPPKG